jgi:hypothetical protein
MRDRISEAENILIWVSFGINLVTRAGAMF